MQNRRSDTRVKVADMMVNAVIAYTDTLSPAQGGVVRDLSRNGLFLKTDTNLCCDSYVSLKLDTEKILGKPMWAQGFVTRTDEQGMGIRFTYIERDILKLLSA
ncbi:MAG: PilZ domain-containing protein [Desulfomonilia bacterium]|jgi:hypothetical protein